MADGDGSAICEKKASEDELGVSPVWLTRFRDDMIVVRSIWRGNESDALVTVVDAIHDSAGKPRPQ